MMSSESTLDPRRDILVKELQQSPQKLAALLFFENIVKYKKQVELREPLISVACDLNGEKLDNVLEDIYDGDMNNCLELTSRFDWLPMRIFKYEDGKKVAKAKGISESELYDSEYRPGIKEIGSTDLRIIPNVDGNKSIKIFANQGSLAGSETLWSVLIDDIAYPMIVEDRMGFKYRNKASGVGLDDSGLEIEKLEEV